MSRYVNLSSTGKIPAFTECPYKEKCWIFKDKTCHHEGVDHDVDFSCASARWHDLDVRNAN
ncbi:MAG: hypothetical protein ISR90_07005, partial [Candidatus Marinimicrobia bacterium]|nr:hypothetical protein [Candidatus Neomarinimicrobiota bacterium]